MLLLNRNPKHEISAQARKFQNILISLSGSDVLFGFNPKVIQSLGEDGDYRKLINFYSDSITKTYNLDLKSNFNKLNQKIELSNEQRKVFETFIEFLLSIGISEEKIIVEDSIEEEIIVGRRYHSGTKMISINSFGDIMFSKSGKDKCEDSREFIDFEQFDAESLAYKFLS